MWRPDDWTQRKEAYRLLAKAEDWDREDIFEAGADAILKHLTSQEHQDWLATPEGESCKGRWAFIPEEV